MFMVNVGKYTSPMDPMGMKLSETQPSDSFVFDLDWGNVFQNKWPKIAEFLQRLKWKQNYQTFLTPIWSN